MCFFIVAMATTIVANSFNFTKWATNGKYQCSFVNFSEDLLR